MYFAGLIVVVIDHQWFLCISILLCVQMSKLISCSLNYVFATFYTNIRSYFKTYFERSVFGVSFYTSEVPFSIKKYCYPPIDSALETPLH